MYSINACVYLLRCLAMDSYICTTIIIFFHFLPVCVCEAFLLQKKTYYTHITPFWPYFAVCIYQCITTTVYTDEGNRGPTLYLYLFGRLYHFQIFRVVSPFYTRLYKKEKKNTSRPCMFNTRPLNRRKDLDYTAAAKGIVRSLMNRTTMRNASRTAFLLLLLLLLLLCVCRPDLCEF